MPYCCSHANQQPTTSKGILDIYVAEDMYFFPIDLRIRY